MERTVAIKDYERLNKVKINENNCAHYARVFESILSKKQHNKSHSSFQLFDDDITKLIHEPQDHETPIINRKDACMRQIYIHMGRMEWMNAFQIFVFAVRNFDLPSSYIWRTGFGILPRIADHASMTTFFRNMLKIEIWDPSNMFYEYFMYLLKMEDYDQLQELYHNSFPRFYQNKRPEREPESKIIDYLIRLLVAVSYFCVWRQSQIANRENISALTQAELEFFVLYKAIDHGINVDSFLQNYVFILKHKNKFDDAFKLLKYYFSKIEGSKLYLIQYLLEFVVEYRPYLSGISEGDIGAMLGEYIDLHPTIHSTNNDKFLIPHFQKYIEYLDKNDRHKDVTILLLKYVEDEGWANIDWVWRQIRRSVHFIDVTNEEFTWYWPPFKKFWGKYVVVKPHLEEMYTVFE